MPEERFLTMLTPDPARTVEVPGGWAERVIDLAWPDAEPEPAVPVVEAVRIDGLYWFWCPWCRRRHCHGGTGHRAAHCLSPSSPFWRSGYVVIEVAR